MSADYEGKNHAIVVDYNKNSIVECKKKNHIELTIRKKRLEFPVKNFTVLKALKFCCFLLFCRI